MTAGSVVPPAARRNREVWIDALRGAAIGLMVLDHLLVQVAPTSVVRVTVTRLSLPLFMFAAAAVWRRRPGARRLVQLGAAAVCEALLFVPLGMRQPGIVAVFLGLTVAGVFTAAGARPLLWGTLGLVQALYVPVPWDGYQPGLLVAWWCLGRLGAQEARPIGERVSLLAPIGRRPLLWYVGHLVVIAGAVYVTAS